MKKRTGKLEEESAQQTERFTGKQHDMSYCPTVRSSTKGLPLVHTEEQGERGRQGSCLHQWCIREAPGPSPWSGSLLACCVKGTTGYHTLHREGYGGGLLLKRQVGRESHILLFLVLTWMRNVDVRMEGLNREETGRNRSRNVRLGWYNLCPSSRSSPWKSSKCWRCWKKMRVSSHLPSAPAKSKAPSGDCAAACDRLKRRCNNFWRRNSWQRRGEVGTEALTVVSETGMWDKMWSSVKRVVGKEVFPPHRWEAIRKGTAKYFQA